MQGPFESLSVDTISTVDEIKSALPNLSTEELYRIERSIHELYRQRDQHIIYDDAYGVWTEEDQASAAAEVFAFIDDQERAGNKIPFFLWKAGTVSYIDMSEILHISEIESVRCKELLNHCQEIP